MVYEYFDSDEIIKATCITKEELELEIAIVQKRISGGRACRWTGLTLLQFQRGLSKRGLNINHDTEDLQSDVKALKGLGLILIVVSDTSAGQTNRFDLLSK